MAIPLWQAGIATALMAATPVLELRAAIPFGVKLFGLTPLTACIAAVIGNALAGVAILYLLPPLESLCVRRLPRCNILIQRYFTSARAKFSGTHAKYGAIGLAIFVGIPLPLTGAWTGAAAAHVMGLPKKLAAASIVAGVIIAGVLVTLATVGVIKLF